VPQACELIGVGPTALRRWVAQWREVYEGPPPDPESVAGDRARIEALQARVLELEAQCELLKKEMPSHLKVLYQRRKRLRK
jgi:transposase